MGRFMDVVWYDLIITKAWDAEYSEQLYNSVLESSYKYETATLLNDVKEANSSN